MSNNYFNQPAFGGFGGTMYNNNLPQPQNTVMKQLLTDNEIKTLRESPQQFSTKLTHNEYLKAICTHKDPHTGVITLQEMNDGRYHCTICGETFYLIDPSTTKEEIDRICGNFNDLFQTIKTFYGDAPDQFKDFYLMCGFIPKLPYLWDIAKKYFERIPMGMNAQPTNEQYGWQLLGNILGNNMMPGMGMGNNMYMAGVPQYNNQPQGNYGYPQAPNNPYGYNPQQQYGQPMPNAPQPNYQQPPVNPSYPNQTQFNNNGYSMPNYYTGNAQGSPYNNPNPGYVNQAPAAPASNPVGYVETPQQDFTQTTQRVSMPGPNVNANTQTPPMPEPPKNPNIKDPSKATVNKQFK